jgi:broad specificity phosphatase PhoE
MRLFVFARHGESTGNAAHLLSTDPERPVGLTPRGTRQARRLGEQIANLDIDRAVCSRFQRTRQTAELALRGRQIPLLVESRLDEVQAGVFDGAPIRAYWAWKEQHSSAERFPDGESLDEAARRYTDALRDLASSPETVTLVVCHEHALRHVLTAAGRGAAETTLENGVPYLLDDHALRRVVECLDALAPPAPHALVA